MAENTKESEHIQLVEGRGGLPEIHIHHGDATLKLCLQGAHITSYKPDGNTELLWLSQAANFAAGQSIRGGIPLCWPWFGQHLINPNESQHGYARTSMFEVVSADSNHLDTRLTLRLNPEEMARHESRTGLRMEFDICLSGEQSANQLWVEIRTINMDETPASVGAALHTYFQVSDVRSIQVPQVQGLQYKDKTRGFKSFSQSEPLQIRSETDRVYLSPPAEVSLIDPGLDRTLSIQTWGNSDLVIWNPWAENARSMADFDDQGYKSMVCIEPANALTNQVLLKAQQKMALGMSIRASH